jgi:hypothetical protein
LVNAKSATIWNCQNLKINKRRLMMAIDKFVEVVEKSFGGEAKEISEVDWSTVSQEALDNNTFFHGEPFYLICPEELWGEIGRLPSARIVCACLDFEGNPIPNCMPKPRLTPFLLQFA